ncbi:MAG: hypothetical protein ACKVTZ_09450, partial [Bacteroidia bacterium]
MANVNFNNWTSLFLIAALQGFFVTLSLLFYPKGNQTANRLLSLLIGSFSVSLLYYVGYWTHFNQQLPFLQGWGEGMILLFGP